MARPGGDVFKRPQACRCRQAHSEAVWLQLDSIDAEHLNKAFAMETAA